MGDDDRWNNLPTDLLIDIAERLDFAGNIIFSAVSKSWKSATMFSEAEAPSPKSPYLLLAETSGGKDDQTTKDTTTRGLFCLSTGKTYNIELAAASGKLILGTDKGWLVTLGRNLEVNLLHPFSKRQIMLPHMLTFKTQYDNVNGEYPPERFFDMFIFKVVMSSAVPSVYDNKTPPPVIMALYGEFRKLAFAKLGDKTWTDVTVDAMCFDDIIYHKSKFYAINYNGVFMCELDDDERGGGYKATKLVSSPIFNLMEQFYLVESTSGDDDILLIISRVREGYPYIQQATREEKYYTSELWLWKLELTHSDQHDDDYIHELLEVKNLGDESVFIGRTSSFSLSSSETIKQNSIYFTDDAEFFRVLDGGGRDMGIYDIEHITVEPHFRGESIHPFSPPLWYIIEDKEKT